MDALLEKLNLRMREWSPTIAADVRQRLTEIIDLADQNALDFSRSRALEQEVLDLIDEPTSR